MLEDLLYAFILINVLLFVFNLIPIPPLDGSHILFALLPGDNLELRMILSRYGFLILLATIFLARSIIMKPVGLIVEWLFQIVGS